MQHELGDHEEQSLSDLLERPASPNQQGLAEGGEESVMAEEDGIWSETVAAAAAAAAAAAFAPEFSADGRDQPLTAGSSDIALTGALDLLASLSDEKWVFLCCCEQTCAC